jgi:hypothetical protein
VGGAQQVSSAHYIFEKEETARKKRVLEEAGGDAEVEAVEDTKKPKKNAPSAVFVFWDLVTETVGGVEKASFECNLDKKYGKSPVKTYQKNGSGVGWPWPCASTRGCGLSARKEGDKRIGV